MRMASRSLGWVAGCGVLVIALAAWWLDGPPAGGEGTGALPAGFDAAPLPCAQVLGCAAQRVMGDASGQCRPQIEQQAVFTPRWTHASGESIFRDYAWLQRERGTITFMGSYAEFQDASGRFGPVAYECDYDPASRQVLGVRVKTAG